MNDEWETPQNLFMQLDQEFHFSIDLACDVSNKKCPIGMTENDDLLKWSIEECHADIVGFLNPPYSNPFPFIKKAYELAKHITVVCLVKCDPSTRWWAIFYDHDKQQPREGVEIRYFPKRIKFVPPPGFTGKDTGPSFPSALIVMRKRCSQK